MKLLRAAPLVPLALMLGCADVPAAPALEGMSISSSDFSPDVPGTVMLRVSVSDRYGTPWLDLETTRAYVRQVLNDGSALKTIVEPDPTGAATCGFVHADEGPSRVVWVVDRSRLGDEVTARQLIASVSEVMAAAPPDVSFALVNVGRTAVVEQDFTTDREALEIHLRNQSVEAGASTLFEGITRGLDLLEEGAVDLTRERAAVVVVTAALDDSSGASFSFQSVAKHGRAVGAPVHILAYGAARQGQLSQSWALDDISSGTGGRYIDGKDAFWAETALTSVLDSIRTSYLICVPGMVVDHGERYADERDVAEMQVTIESFGSAIETSRAY